MSEDKAPVLRLDQVGRAYKEGKRDLVVLDGADFELKPGEIVALVAPSGAGKSTLLHLAGLLEKPDAGEVYVGGCATRGLADDEPHGAAAQRDRLRLPVPPSAAGVHRARKPDDAADDSRRLAKHGARAGAATARLHAHRRARDRTARPNFPAASSSASPSPAPSPMRRGSCSPTSRPAILTPTLHSMSSMRWKRWCAPAASPP